jgi:type I restriction enzyme, S subunit
MKELVQLPKDWKWVKVGEYVISVKGKKPKRISIEKTKECSIPYVNIKAFEKNIIDEYTDGVGCVLCEDGDFLMVWDGSRSGYVGKGIKGALGSTLVKLDFPDINNNYAYYFLQSKFLDINTRAKGVGIPHVDPNILWNYDLLIPPKPTQQAIVSKIEELFSELDKGIENLRMAQQQLKTYRQSVLKWAFAGKLTNNNVKEGELPKGWKHVSITELAEKNKHALKAGPFGSSLKKEFYVEKGYKIYGQEQVISGDAFYGNYYIDEKKYQELSSCKIKPFDILISLVGTVGKVLLLPENCEPGIINPRLIKISLEMKIYLPKFFKYYFESSMVKSFYSGETRGTTMDVLNLGIIKTIPFPLCTIEEQDNIVQAIESRLSVADKMEEGISQSLQQAEALRQSILKKAFEGRLITEIKETSKIKIKNVKPVTKKQQAKVIPITQEDFPRKIAGISETDLHAGIIAMIIKSHESNPKYLSKLNHVKCEKIADQVERKIGICLGRNAVKDAAGPDDFPHLKKVEHRANKAAYFRTKALHPIGHTYKPMRGMQNIIAKAKNVLPEKELREVDKLIQIFLPFELEHAELVATLFAGWNNLVLSGKTPTDEEIVYESRENWSERKLTIDRKKFFKTISWMKEHGFIPEGKGKMVLKSKGLMRNKMSKSKKKNNKK